jgi:hypothetical protein
MWQKLQERLVESEPKSVVIMEKFKFGMMYLNAECNYSELTRYP